LDYQNPFPSGSKIWVVIALVLTSYHFEQRS